jgi:hypothetical protein
MAKIDNQIGVVRCRGAYRLVSTRPIPRSGYLFDVEGQVTDTPTRYTLQVGAGAHIDLPGRHEPEEVLDRYFWRFMNHSCEPSAVIRGRRVFALTALEPWQEITFHYNTTEYDMAEPFICRCHSARCAGTIQGFRYLSRSEREPLRPWLANHLSAILDGYEPEPAARPKASICR